MKRAIVWFRNDLRVHDNEALYTAMKEKMQILPLFCFDPILQSQSAVGKFIKSGPLRTKFLIESVSDLRRNLQAINSNLLIKTGKPAAVIQQLKQQYNIDTVIFHKEVCDEELIDEKDVSSIKGLTIVKPWGHTLIHQDDLPAEMHMGKVPLVYTHFRTKVEKKGLDVRDPLPTPKSINTIEVEDWGTIPTLEQLGYKNVPNDTRAVGVFQGGETVGLQHVKDYIWSKDQLLSSYKETRNDLLGMGASSKFSPWLSLGCISPRYVYQQVKEYESKVEKNESTYWIVFELLWRDYFRFLAPQFGNKIFHLNGINKHKDQRKWSYDQEQLQSWIDGKTGHPMVDANMRELKHTGWMSNRGRQIVASFLAKLMYMDWRFGAEWFESQLIDYDVTSNWLNWMYQAGVGNDPRGAYRIFNPIKQARDFDPQGEYIKKWVPELKDVPAEKLATPWEMSDTEQKQSGCVIGKDYPNPIVAIERPKSAQKRKQPTAKNHKGQLQTNTVATMDEETERMMEEMEAEFDRINESMTQEEKNERFKRVETLYEDSPLFWTKLEGKDSKTVEAIQAVLYDDDPNDVARNFKDQGNLLLKEHPNDKKFYADVIKFYDQGLEQKITDLPLLATLLTNRAHVNILLGNYGYALQDARKCLKYVEPNNVKAMYRVAKAAGMLNRWKLSLQYCEKALKLDPKNKDLAKLKQTAEAGLVKQFELKEKEKQLEARRRQIPKKLAEMLQSKGIKIGFSEMDSQHFNQLGVSETLGIQIDPSTSELSFRVLFAYPEFNQTDCIQAFAETHTFRDHLDVMFPPNGPPFPFGDAKAQRNYVLPKLRLFYYDQKTRTKVHDKYVEIDIDSSLSDILTKEDYYLPGSLMPVFYVIHEKSPYLEEWKIKR